MVVLNSNSDGTVRPFHSTHCQKCFLRWTKAHSYDSNDRRTSILLESDYLIPCNTPKVIGLSAADFVNSFDSGLLPETLMD